MRSARPELVMRSIVVGGAALVFLTFGGAVGFMLGVQSVSVPIGASAPGPVSGGFVQDLLPQHRQLAEVTSFARDRAADPEIRRLAAAIASGAGPELGTIDGWRTAWGVPERPAAARLAWMVLGAGDAHDHGGLLVPTVEPGPDLLPGMASEGELRALRASVGQEFDALLLQLLLRHHESSEPMLDYASQVAESPAVRDLALGILEGQAAESTRLRSLLAARGAAPVPPG